MCDICGNYPHLACRAGDADYTTAKQYTLSGVTTESSGVLIPSSTIEVPDIDRDPVGRSASGMKLAEALHCFHSVRLLTCWSLPQVYKLAFQSLQFKRTTNATENVHSKVYLASSRQKIIIISCRAYGLLTDTGQKKIFFETHFIHE